MTRETGAAQAEPPGLSVAAVARRMGVAPATLRTWDRRYGVGPSDHRPGSHRRYGPGDLARLEHMRRLVISGVPPADAARSARELDLDAQPLAAITELPTTGRDRPETASRSGGGRVVALPGGPPAVRGLARAAQALDCRSCTDIVGESLERRGVVWTWDHLVVPVLVGIGQQWSETGRGVEVEHALSSAVQEALSERVRNLGSAVNQRPVLLACAPDELHSLPLWAVSAALAERRISARMLGASLPAGALASAMQRIGPAVVFIWAQLSSTANTTALAGLPALRPAATVLVGGPGWSGLRASLPADVTVVDDLTDTVGRIAFAVGG